MPLTAARALQTLKPGLSKPHATRSLCSAPARRPTGALRRAFGRCQSLKTRTLGQHAPAALGRDPLCLVLPALLWFPGSASAEDLPYSPGQGADIVKQVAGLAYVGLLAFWLFKVIGRRINSSKTERLASEQEREGDTNDPTEAQVTFGAAFLGAAQASFFTYLLFLFSNSVSGYFSHQQLPDQYTARNITVTFRTAIAGLAYLATFIFGANAVGLTGLSLKLLLSTEKEDRSSAPQDLSPQKPEDRP